MEYFLLLWFVLAHVCGPHKDSSIDSYLPTCTVPTRLFALKHGADLVWGPETVDKAILHAERVIDRQSNHCLHYLLV